MKARIIVVVGLLVGGGVGATEQTPEQLQSLLSQVRACVQELKKADAPTSRTTQAHEVARYLAAQYQHPLLREKLVCLTRNDCSLPMLLQDLARCAGINIVIDEQIKGYVPVFSVENLSLSKVLRVLLDGRQPRLGVLVFDNILRIAPEKMLRVVAQKHLQGVEATCEQRVIVLQHITLSERIKLRIERMWEHVVRQHSGPARQRYIFFDEPHRQVLVQGTKKQVVQLASFLDTLDRPSYQVKIEARIVLASKDFEKSLGFNWQVAYDSRSSAGHNFSFVGLGHIATEAMNWALHLFPSAAEKKRTVEVPLVFGGSNLSARRLNIVLNAAEQAGEIRTLLKPSILSFDGQQAELLEGEVVPIESMVEESVEGRVRNVRSAQYKEVGMQLKVKPAVLPGARAVHLDIHVENSYVKEESGSTATYPTIITSRARNKVVLKSGETTMIGGLIKNARSIEHNRVPFLSTLPVIGSLFRGKREAFKDSQLLIFITPILQQAVSGR